MLGDEHTSWRRSRGNLRPKNDCLLEIWQEPFPTSVARDISITQRWGRAGKHGTNAVNRTAQYENARQHNVPSVSHRHACTIKTRRSRHFPRKLSTCPLRGILVRNWTLCIKMVDPTARSDFPVAIGISFDERTGGLRRPPVRQAVALRQSIASMPRSMGIPHFPAVESTGIAPGLAFGLAGDVVEIGEQRPGGLQTGSNRTLRPAGPLYLSKSLRPAPRRGSSLSAPRCRTVAWSDRRSSRLLRPCA
jgi:hypothetical protein